MVSDVEWSSWYVRICREVPWRLAWVGADGPWVAGGRSSLSLTGRCQNKEMSIDV